MMENIVDDLVDLSESFPFGFIIFNRLEDGGNIIGLNQQMCTLCGYDTKSELLAAVNNLHSNLMAAGDYAVIYSKVMSLLLQIKTSQNPTGNSGGLPDHESPDRNFFTEAGSYHEFYRIITKSGKAVDIEAYGSIIYDPAYGYTIALYAKPSKDTDNRIYDQLTGLYKRTYLLSWLKSQYKYNPDEFSSHTWSIICFNIADFRSYNNHFGFRSGDRYLTLFSDLLTSVFDTDLIARTYADHFVVFYDGDDTVEKIHIIHNKAVEIAGGIPVWIESGVYYWKPACDVIESIDLCIDRAWSAFDTIHGTRKYYYAIYSKKIALALEKNVYIQTHISEAIRNGLLEIYLQPVVRTLTGKISSFEALSRWNDPVYGMISPATFIPALEAKNLSYKLAAYVIDKAASIISSYEKSTGKNALPISVNLSYKDIDMLDLLHEFNAAVARYNIKSSQLCAEITESTAVEKPARIREIISSFHDAGYSVWMDDFGSSYSSLNALKDFDFDEIKLDMAFIKNMNERGRKIVKNCVNMAKDLGIHTLCEGVESKAQLEFLRDLGCEKIQGYYYSKPYPADEIIGHLISNHMEGESEREQMLYDMMSTLKFNQDKSWFLSVVTIRGNGKNSESDTDMAIDADIIGESSSSIATGEILSPDNEVSRLKHRYCCTDKMIIEFVYASKRLKSETKKRGLRVLPETYIPGRKIPSLQLKLQELIVSAANSNSSETSFYFQDYRSYKLESKKLADYDGAYLCCTEISDISI